MVVTDSFAGCFSTGWVSHSRSSVNRGGKGVAYEGNRMVAKRDDSQHVFAKDAIEKMCRYGLQICNATGVGLYVQRQLLKVKHQGSASLWSQNLSSFRSYMLGFGGLVNWLWSIRLNKVWNACHRITGSKRNVLNAVQRIVATNVKPPGSKNTSLIHTSKRMESQWQCRHQDGCHTSLHALEQLACQESQDERRFTASARSKMV